MGMETDPKPMFTKKQIINIKINAIKDKVYVLVFGN